MPEPLRIIACGAFRPALSRLGVHSERITYLPSHLHLQPATLKKELEREVLAAHQRGERVVCLYGCCFPEIDDFCTSHQAARPPGAHCYEILLGQERYRRIMEQDAGTYFLERSLLEDFEEHCAKPLELDDEEIRRTYFAHYRRLLYLRQPGDGEALAAKAAWVAEFLELELDVQDADDTCLQEFLKGLG
jgi:hypothetical protein